VDPQRLGSIRTFSISSTALLSGGLSMWIDGVAAMKVDFVEGVCCCFNCYSYRLFFKGRWLLCWLLTLLSGGCVRAAVSGGMILVEVFFYVWWVRVLVQRLFSSYVVTFRLLV